MVEYIDSIIKSQSAIKPPFSVDGVIELSAISSISPHPVWMTKIDVNEYIYEDENNNEDGINNDINHNYGMNLFNIVDVLSRYFTLFPLSGTTNPGNNKGKNKDMPATKVFHLYMHNSYLF